MHDGSPGGTSCRASSTTAAMASGVEGVAKSLTSVLITCGSGGIHINGGNVVAAVREPPADSLPVVEGVNVNLVAELPRAAPNDRDVGIVTADLCGRDVPELDGRIGDSVRRCASCGSDTDKDFREEEVDRDALLVGDFTVNRTA
jgi:hypothetical protein